MERSDGASEVGVMGLLPADIILQQWSGYFEREGCLEYDHVTVPVQPFATKDRGSGIMLFVRTSSLHRERCPYMNGPPFTTPGLVTSGELLNGSVTFAHPKRHEVENTNPEPAFVICEVIGPGLFFFLVVAHIFIFLRFWL